MKHQWLAYLIVGLLSVGAGVAIAGLPDNVPVDATIIPPTSTATTDATTTTTTEAPASTTSIVPTTVPETSEPATSEPAISETSEPTDSVPQELPDRGDLFVVAANGANVAGAALRMATQLEEIGYVEVAQLNGSDIVEFSVVYHADGFEEAAQRLAADLELLPEFVAPLNEAPAVVDLPADVELLVYVGRDRA